MRPDELGAAVQQAGAQLGGRGTVLLLVDLAQQVLRPLAAAEAGRDEEPVDGSPAGEAFRSEAPVQEQTDGGVRLWIPVLDSAERLGVLRTMVDDVGSGVLRSWMLLGGLVGELIVAKSRYGDGPLWVRRTEDVALAAEMRWSLLPPLTFTSPDIVVSAILEPAYDVAGDTFDYAVNGDIAHVALFDAIGHGMEASRMANVVVGAYRHRRRRGEGLLDMARAMDEVIREEFGDCRFVTGQLATLDLPSGVLTVLNLGHPRPIVFRADGAQEELLGARCVPLGLGPAALEATAAPLRPGDVVLFHTDGITEARDGDGEFFGTERLQALVGELLAERLRPAEVLRRVVGAVLAHQPRLRDDATLLLLGWRLGEAALPPGVRSVASGSGEASGD
jgi:hypothetical protein